MPTALGAGMLLASSAAMAAPVLDLSITNTATGTTDTFTNAGTTTSPNTEELSRNGTIGAYDYTVSVTATDLLRTDELFEVNIHTTTNGSPSGRLITDLEASGFTGFSGSTRASSVTSPSSVVSDLDIETFVNGTTILDEENLNAPDVVTDTQVVPMSSPYSIRHLTEIEHDIADTTTFDTTTTVPAPATLGLMGAALIGLGVAARRRREIDV